MGLEDLPPREERATPHASLIVEPGELPGIDTGIWMGGAHSQMGKPVSPARLSTGWLLDLAGEVPEDLRRLAQREESVVFADIDAHPAAWDRLTGIASEWAEHLRAGHMDSRPSDVFVVCQYGMNRSGLGTGLLLRALGIDAEEAVRRIMLARPGALSNATYRRLVYEWRR
ncbi:MAG: hypothetical protein U5Q44_14795 [Dehalococcoidia bacterium]|nr:hypothetical protein [Dehalococcoidia bacterium]